MEATTLIKKFAKKVICIVGPTGTGKSDLAIHLAKQLNGEIINADATQFYRHMDIGTNKVTVAEQAQAVHHLIDIVDLDEPYTVSQYQRDGRQVIKRIHDANKVAIVVGGSGLYINALLKNYDFLTEKINPQIEEKKLALNKLTNTELWERLNQIDSDYAQIIHLNNRQRVLRAILFYYNHNKTKSAHIKESQNQKSLYDVTYLGPTYLDKASYVQKLRTRIQKHAHSGLVNEVASLYNSYNMNKNLKAISYKEIIEYLDKKITLNEALDLILQNNIKLAKKQLTWFKYQIKNIQWFKVSYERDFQETIKEVETFLSN